jgi:hypothetical protein
MAELMKEWAVKYDPLLLANPLWYRTIQWVNVVFFGPYYFVAMIAFLRGQSQKHFQKKQDSTKSPKTILSHLGSSWIRVPSLLFSAASILSLALIFAEVIHHTFCSNPFTQLT